jgi:hypothetical protein
MRIRKRNRIIKRMVLGFAVVALVVPSAAMASVDEGISGQPNSAQEIAKDQGGVQLADPKYGQEGDVAVQLADPKYGQEPVYVPFVTDFPKYEQTTTPPEPTTTPQVVVSDGFDWGDALIGAGILAGLLVLIGGAAFAVREHARPQAA